MIPKNIKLPNRHKFNYRIYRKPCQKDDAEILYKSPNPKYVSRTFSKNQKFDEHVEQS